MVIQADYLSSDCLDIFRVKLKLLVLTIKKKTTGLQSSPEHILCPQPKEPEVYTDDLPTGCVCAILLG